MAEDPRAVVAEILREARAFAEWEDAKHAAYVAKWLARYDAACIAAVLPIKPPADESDLETLHADMLRAIGVPESGWPADMEAYDLSAPEWRRS